MQKLRILLAAICLTAVGGMLVYGLAAEKKDDDVAEMRKQVNELLLERANTAQTCFDATHAAYQAETVTMIQLTTAMNNLIEAKLAVATTPQEVIAALEEHVTRTQDVEQKVKQLYNLGLRGGEAETYALAKFTNEGAQIRLLTARLKAKQ
jgi:hypothetical protein